MSLNLCDCVKYDYNANIYTYMLVGLVECVKRHKNLEILSSIAIALPNWYLLKYFVGQHRVISTSTMLWEIIEGLVGGID